MYVTEQYPIISSLPVYCCKWVTGSEVYIAVNYNQGSGHFHPGKSWHAHLNFNQ